MGRSTKQRSKTRQRLEPIEVLFPTGREQSYAEWEAARRAAYAKLREYGIHPSQVDPVEAFLADHEVTWFRDPVSRVARGRVSAPGETVQPQQLAKKVHDRFATLQPVATVGESLALTLLSSYLTLKDAERSGVGAPVRSRKLLSPRVISTIAIDLLDFCRARGHPPGPQLISLLSVLLSVGELPQKAPQDFAAREHSVQIDATEPGLSTRTVGAKVGVAGTTILRWRRDAEYQRAVAAERLKQV